MPLEPGTTLLQYRLVEKIGAGGMGVVWKAVDTSLGREVAIKVLPAALAGDPDHLTRFEREARLLASLNHPNIAGIFGVHHADGVHFLAMELVAGEDLAARLEKGPLPLESALQVARDVATGLEAAHERGVIHRDLKPSNVRMTADGSAKVLDFGLAKAVETAVEGSSDASLSPTMTSMGTAAGMILGTASYMSPEQAAGQPIDRRCDIWSFGVLLSELLSGKRMFHGETLSHTLADVLRAEIDLTDLPPDVPPAIRRLLHRCLERDPKRRLRDIGEARIALQDALDHPEAAAEAAAVATVPAPRSARWPWLVAALGLALAGVSLVWTALGAHAPAEPVRRFTVTMPNAGNLRQGDGAAIAISPDGRLIVTRGGAGTDDILYVRDMGAFDARPLEGTAGAQIPQFSPDGRWIAFLTSTGFQKIRVTGGARLPIGWIPAAGAGYTWADDGWIYYANEGQIWRRPADGGDPEQLTQADLEEGERFNLPHKAAGADVVFCSTSSSPGVQPMLFALDLKSRTMKNLEMPGSDARYLSPGFLLFQQSGAAVVARFDLATLEFTGSPVAVLKRLWVDEDQLQLDVARDGTVAYLPRRPGETQSLVYVDLAGKVEPVAPSGLPFSAVSDPRISPDGTRLTVTADAGTIWMIDLRTQTSTLLTESGFYAVWSPDGSEILFTTARNKTYDVYRVPVDLSRPEEMLLDVENNMRTMDWTAQGVVVLREEIPKKGMDLRIWTDLGDPSTVANLLDGTDDELAPIVSPDGRWMAYVSDYSGSDEIYVTSFPVPGPRSKVSNAGGNSPTWSPDGRTLYYLEGLRMMAVSVETEPAFRVLSRDVLFEGQYVQYRWSRQYDLAPGGERFLMIQNPPRGDVEVVTNWFEELRDLQD
jgi:serine/threonine-protein kinase